MIGSRLSLRVHSVEQTYRMERAHCQLSNRDEGIAAFLARVGDGVYKGLELCHIPSSLHETGYA